MRRAIIAIERSPMLRSELVVGDSRWRIVESFASEWHLDDDERRILHGMARSAARS